MTDAPTANSLPEQLKADTILSAEFSYIAATAAQANDDRSTVTNFLLTTIGTLAAIVLGFQANIADATMYKATSLLLLSLSIFGVITLLQLMGLRRAWHHSIVAMNQIKDYYIDTLGSTHPHLYEAFAWRRITCPKHHTPLNFSWLLIVQVVFMGTLTFGGAAFFAIIGFADLGLSDSEPIAIFISLLAGTVYAAGTYSYYVSKMTAANKEEARACKRYENEREKRRAERNTD